MHRLQETKKAFSRNGFAEQQLLKMFDYEIFLLRFYLRILNIPQTEPICGIVKIKC
jgi:hypothetical protein